MKRYSLAILFFIICSTLLAQKQKFIWGVWYNSYQKPFITLTEKKDRELFSQHLAFFKSIGINRIYFLVKFPTGHVFYKSKIAPIYPQLDWDPLAFIIQECRRLEIEIYPYINVYAEGDYNQETKQYDIFGPYLEKFPSRAMMDQKGTRYSWACPAIQEVNNYELSIIKEIVQNYDIDGIQLDRIRYPYGYLCYNPASTSLYEKKYNKKPSEEDYSWTVFRQDLLTDFVLKSRKAVYEIKPNLKFSAAVFPRPHATAKNELQAWYRWTQRDMLDEVVPMTYYKTEDLFETYLSQDLEVTPPSVPLLAGIGSFFIPDVKIMKAQIDFALKMGVQGIVFFNGFDLLNPSFGDAVKEYNQKKN